jgi:hypothetical protein
VNSSFKGEETCPNATVIFFGIANCWNTAHEAELLVQLYPRYQDQIRFLLGRERSSGAQAETQKVD